MLLTAFNILNNYLEKLDHVYQLRHIHSHANPFFFLIKGSNACLGDKIHSQIVILNNRAKRQQEKTSECNMVNSILTSLLKR